MKRALPFVVAGFFLLLLLAAIARAAPGDTERVSVDSSENEGGQYQISIDPAINADGRFVAFESNAVLVPEDGNGSQDIYVRDRQTGRTIRVSVKTDGSEGISSSYDPALNASGRFVAFASASALTPDDDSNNTDIFVRDRDSDGDGTFDEPGAVATVRISLPRIAGQETSHSYNPAISADGRFVAFESQANNLVEGDGNNSVDIFVRDRDSDGDGIFDEPGAAATSRVSVSSAGAEGHGFSYNPTISADGRFVAFESQANNLVADDTNGDTDVFLRDRASGKTSRISVTSAEEERDGRSEYPSISADGRYIAFQTEADLGPGDTVHYDIYVRDRVAGTTTQVSLAHDGGQPNQASQRPSISADGNYVAFRSAASNLVVGRGGGWGHIFVRNRQDASTVHASVSSEDEPAQGHSDFPAISANGVFVAFESGAPNLVAGDNNLARDTFVHQPDYPGDPAADLAVTKSSATDPASPGEEVRWTVRVRNNGPSAATGVMLTDTLPPGVTLVSAVPSRGSCSSTDNPIVCSLGTLAVGTGATINIVVTVDATGGTLTNEAVGTAGEYDPNTLNNTATDSVTVEQRPTPVPTATASATVPPSATPTQGPTATATATQLPSQFYRDVGKIRVWAARFIDNADGTTTATGNVNVGPNNKGEEGRYFSVSDSAVWARTGPVTLTGVIGFVEGGQSLGRGTSTVKTTTGELTWRPDSRVLVTRLGESSIAISPTLTINMLRPQVNAVTRVNMLLPEQNRISNTLQFLLAPNGVITGTSRTEVDLGVAGGKLSATVRASSRGLVAAEASYVLSGTARLTLTDLVIDGAGETKLRFGGSGEFNFPDVNLGNGFFVLSNLKGRLAVTTGTPSKYEIGLTGKVSLPRLPENSGITINTASVKVADGKFQGKLSNVNLKVAGQKLTLKELSFGEQPTLAAARAAGPAAPLFSYTLFSKEAELTMPSSWSPPNTEQAILLQNVTIQDHEPYIQIGLVGTSFSTAKPFYLAGDADANASVRFDEIEGSIRYNIAEDKWEIGLSTKITFKFGQESSVATEAALTVKEGKVSGEIKEAELKVAGLKLTIETLKYEEDAFTAESAMLELPKSWGSGSVTVRALRITKDGLALGGGGGRFTFPDRELSDVLRLSNLSASVAIARDKTYTIVVTGTLTIQKIQLPEGGNGSVSAGANLVIENGFVRGSLTSFGFNLAGLEFEVTQPRFLNDRVTAETFRIVLPENLGGAGVTLYGLEIGGPEGFKVQGGGFRLPDFMMGNVGVQNVRAEFMKLPDGSYSIKAGAKLAFQAFAVEGTMTMVYAPPSSLQLRQVSIVFEGTIPTSAIPVANTGFFITRISGGFDLTTGSLRIDFGLRGAFAAEVAGISLLSVDANMTLVVDPFELTIRGNTRMLGITVGESQVRITPTSFRMDGRLELQVARGLVTLAFGLDANRQFTFYGSAGLEIGLRKGSIGCFVFVCIPPSDVTLGRQNFDAGKFRKDGGTVWGARATTDLWGFKLFIFARFAPGGLGIDAGTNLTAYQPVLPATLASNPPAGSEPADQPPASSQLPDQPPVRSEPAGGSVEGYATADRVTYHATVTGQATRLTIAEAVTETNRAAPEPLTVTNPAGAPVAAPLAYVSDDGALRIYAVELDAPDQAIGTWALSADSGNALMVWGADPAAQIARFEVTAASGAALASASEQPAPRVIQAPDQAFRIVWEASNNEPGLALEVYAVGESGMRYPIAAQQTDTERSLAGETTWTPAVPSGTYTLTLAVDDFRNVTTYAAKEPIVIVDNTPPAAPRGLQAQPRPDGSVLLTWDGAAAEADVLGYLVSVDGRPPIRVLSRLDRFETHGLSLGSTHQVSVAAFDLSGNVGPAATVGVTIPAFGVTATSPWDGETTGTVVEVSAVFNEPVTGATLTVVNADGAAVAGTTSPVTRAISPTESETVGARFVPAAGLLPPGRYTATIRARKVGTGTAVEYSWQFTVVRPNPPVLLPLVIR